jgi:hypothetical protein
MQMDDTNARPEECSLPLLAGADLHDHLMVSCNDLDRLQTLLANACMALMEAFYGASGQLQKLHPQIGAEAAARMQRHLGGAVTALQFQDMASQLISHTHRRLRCCADRLASQPTGAVPPLQPNPVTRDEMDAGPIELF